VSPRRVTATGVSDSRKLPIRSRKDNRISGEKIIGKRRLPTNNRITIALKMATTALRTSNTYLGAQFRRL
jgi:hypothetical protein